MYNVDNKEASGCQSPSRTDKVAAELPGDPLTLAQPDVVVQRVTEQSRWWSVPVCFHPPGRLKRLSAAETCPDRRPSWPRPGATPRTASRSDGTWWQTSLDELLTIALRLSFIGRRTRVTAKLFRLLLLLLLLLLVVAR